MKELRGQASESKEAQLRAEKEAYGWKEECAKLKREKTQLEGAMGEMNLAAKWRERYEVEKKEKDSLLATLNTEGAHRIIHPNMRACACTHATHSRKGGGNILDMHEKLKGQFQQYRASTMVVIEEKDLLLKSAGLSSNGSAGRGGAGGGQSGGGTQVLLLFVASRRMVCHLTTC